MISQRAPPGRARQETPGWTVPRLKPSVGTAARRIQGLAEAQVALASMYLVGSGVQEDRDEAMRWLRRAAEQGNPDGQFALGNSYADGVTLPQNGAEGVRWLRLAADQGHLYAQYYLGLVFSKRWFDRPGHSAG